jgi:hypothetical protein
MRALLRDETGVVALTVLLLFPPLMILGVLAVDVGNWYVHKRQLQIQADAGALAAASFYTYPCDDTAISNVARDYAGGGRNRFDGGAEARIPAANLAFRLNQPTFFNQPSAPNPPDDGMTGSPCADAAVDVKMTETSVPWLFGKSFVPNINAQARVAIRRLEGLKGMLPVALPVPDPKRVRITFISEVTGETLGVKDLCARSAAINGLNIWDNAAGNPAGWDSTGNACKAGTAPTPKSLNFDDPAPGSKWERVGMIVQLSGATNQIDCGQPLVQCFQSGTSGLGFIHGWSDLPAVTDAANSAPHPRSVVLLPGTCGDAYFNTKTATCTIGVSAAVDFQPRQLDGLGNVRKVTDGRDTFDAVGVNAIVTTSTGTTTYPLAWSPSTKRWTAANISIPPGGDASTVKLSWEQRDNTVVMSGTAQPCTTRNNNPCHATFPGVLQRTVSANSTVAGPIKLLQIGNLTSSSGVNDVKACSPGCGEDFVVTVGIGGTLALSEPTDPPSVLRVTGGSQTQAIDCDPAIANLKDEIASGCGPAYGRNIGQACPDHSASATQPAGATWFCVWTKTGQSPSQISAGMNKRLLGDEKATACTAPNRWPNYAPNDPRIIPVFLVPFGSFGGSGNASFPVSDFAYFYITGWTAQGAGFANPCQGNGDDPVPGNDEGLIVGHFIKHVDTLSVGGAGDTPCDLTTISGCVAVMTR